MQENSPKSFDSDKVIFRIEKLIEQLDLNIRQFTDRIDSSYSAVYQIRQGSLPSIKVVAKLAMHLNVNLYWLLFGEEPIFRNEETPEGVKTNVVKEDREIYKRLLSDDLLRILQRVEELPKHQREYIQSIVEAKIRLFNAESDTE